MSKYLKSKKQKLLKYLTNEIKMAKEDYDTIDYGKPDNEQLCHICNYIMVLQMIKENVEVFLGD